MTTAVVPERLHAGWYFLALAEELTGEITPLTVGRRALIAVREDDGRVRAFDARCPHRGAHLGYGGVRAGDCIVCPFHGKRIALGSPKARRSVHEYPTLLVGEALFLRLAPTAVDDHGFEQVMREIGERQRLVGAVCQRVRVPTDVLVEDAFDVDHFARVHLVPRITGMEIKFGPAGELRIEGEFHTNAPKWESAAGGEFASRFFARAFSPSVVVTEIGPADTASTVVTGGTPTAEGAIARVAVGMAGARGEALDALVHGARYAIRQDLAVWDNLDLSAPAKFDSRDRQVLAFRRFCAMFAALDG
jgi:3-ketosteroid 9alpha-monooxygenase subunit A